jgi:hypothetical protein
MEKMAAARSAICFVNVCRCSILPVAISFVSHLYQHGRIGVFERGNKPVA